MIIYKNHYSHFHFMNSNLHLSAAFPHFWAAPGSLPGLSPCAPAPKKRQRPRRRRRRGRGNGSERGKRVT